MKSICKKTHPEQGEDECFVTNADSEIYLCIGWETKRKGKLAYDSNGEPLGSRWHGSFPVFVKKEEVREHDPKVLQDLEA